MIVGYKQSPLVVFCSVLCKEPGLEFETMYHYYAVVAKINLAIACWLLIYFLLLKCGCVSDRMLIVSTWLIRRTCIMNPFEVY
jgi:hypothetical protein